MGVNWAAGLMRWKPHIDAEGNAFSLNHLHPFRFTHLLPAKDGRQEMVVEVRVGFALHCFTADIGSISDTAGEYRDEREVRLFHHQRYRLSRNLKQIVSTLPQRHCLFAKHQNFVTVDSVDESGIDLRYGVFFNLRKIQGLNAVLLVVQSAYVLDISKASPGQGKIGFNVLLGHALRGSKPRRP